MAANVSQVMRTNPVPQNGSTMLASRRKRLVSHKTVIVIPVRTSEFSR
jgi:hypothetical protein